MHIRIITPGLHRSYVLDLEIFLDLWQKIPSPTNTLLGFNHLTICEYIPQIAFAGSGSIW
jgi:hypothetical protein